MTNFLKIKFFFKKIFIESLNFNNFFNLTNKNALRIIMFHDTPEEYQDIYERQIKFLISDGWKILDPKKFIKKKNEKKKFLGKNLVITFDDGLRSNKIFAEKLKKKFGVKSIFFVPYLFTRIKKRSEVKKFCLDKLKLKKNNYQKLNLNSVDLKDLIKKGHVIGSHTISHPNLKKINSLKILKKEIIGSKRLLENLVKKKINIFAFTYGTLKDISQTSIDISLNNYDLIFSGIRGDNSKNNKILFRDEINNNYSNKMCRSFLNGNADFVYNLSRNKLMKMCQ